MTTPHTGLLLSIEELPPLQDHRLYEVHEASQYTRMSARWLNRAAGADRIQHTRLGKFKRWSAQNIRDIVAGVPHKSAHKSRAKSAA
ncbi:hypothetical protein J7E97_07830 [Streptomyces sp. ISL-66]|uniref:hypothetical protein n=1 Tax=Streptomyces sp. ISL-66 TaxID=2819186 RepID=UPI001BEB67E6|nr:hypothetical protein [Streptomyces sp. ISL-66]MBT2467782.1 hypothetical protein [Streptomyces sp. ISL-66]